MKVPKSPSQIRLALGAARSVLPELLRRFRNGRRSGSFPPPLRISDGRSAAAKLLSTDAVLDALAEKGDLSDASAEKKKLRSRKRN